MSNQNRKNVATPNDPKLSDRSPETPACPKRRKAKAWCMLGFMVVAYAMTEPVEAAAGLPQLNARAAVRCSAWLGHLSFGVEVQGHKLPPIDLARRLWPLSLRGKGVIVVKEFDWRSLASRAGRILDVVRSVLWNLVSAMIANNNISAAEADETIGGSVVTKGNRHI